MRSFKQYLSEAVVDFAPWHCRDVELLNHTANSVMPAYYDMVVNKDQTVSFKGIADIKVQRLTDFDRKDVIPFKIKTAYKNMFIDIRELTSLWGCPDKASQSLTIKSSALTSLEHCTPRITRDLTLITPALTEFNCQVKCGNWFVMNDTAMTGLNNIHKHIECDRVILGMAAANKIKSNVLGLMLIKNLKGFSQNGNNKLDLEKVKEIINKHLYLEHDLMDCKEELMENGLKDYAKL